MTESPPTLTQFVIYEHPSDFPEWFVVRKWHIGQGTLRPDLTQWICETLDDARLIVGDELVGGVCMPNSLLDDPSIVETWM